MTRTRNRHQKLAPVFTVRLHVMQRNNAAHGIAVEILSLMPAL